jgi:methionine--tRNA ligase beta chain
MGSLLPELASPVSPTFLPIPAPVGSAATGKSGEDGASAGASKKVPVESKLKEDTKSKVSSTGGAILANSTAVKATKEAADSDIATGGDGESLDPSKLDLRVGLIVKCWNHPEAEKLLCEEIDLAEASGPRSIASGLRAHYAAEDMVGKRVIVVANLKEAKLVGFKSNGMVLCACSADRSVIKLLEPPTDAVVGERVVFESFSGEPASSSVMAKKKVLEKLAPGVSLKEFVAT